MHALHPAGVVPLELWDASAGGASLFDARADTRFFGFLAAVTVALREGTASTARAGQLAPCPWEAVAIVGGGVDRSRAAEAFAAAGVPLALVDADPFFAVSAARAWLGPDDVAIDVGQTAIKAVGPAGRARRERPRGHDLDHDERDPAARRAALAAEIADAARAVRGAATPATLLLALPCEVHGDPTFPRSRVRLGASSYATEGDAEALVRAILEGVHPDGGTSEIADVCLVNDAVLAAHAVRARIGASRRVLVLTIGFGVGAALVDRAERAS